MNKIDIVKLLPTNPNVKPYPKRTLDKIKYIVVHCADASSCTPTDINRWHTEERGWSRIGYSYVIAKNGNVYLTNYITTISNHVANNNTASIGICLEGAFDRENLSSKQETALIELIKFLHEYQAKNVGGTPWAVRGHREFSRVSKTCPGTNINLDKLRLKTNS